MAFPPLVNRFTFDPAPDGIDPVVADWVDAQLRRIQTDMIALIQDSEMALPELPRWGIERIPAGRLRVVGGAGSPGTASDGGLLFDPTTVETVPILTQMPKDWVAGSQIRPAVYWNKSVNGAGDVLWQIRHRIWNLGSVAPAWSAWLNPESRSMTLPTTTETVADYWARIDMTGIEKTALVSFELRRNPTGPTDVYASDAKLWSFCYTRLRIGSGTYNEYGPW